MSFAAVLLAGGGSRRMGRDKAGLAWGGVTLLAHQAATLRATGASELLVSCRAEQVAARVAELGAEFRVVVDVHPDSGPAAALDDAWRATRADVLLVLALDLPRMNAEYLRELVARAQTLERSVVPVHSGLFEPLAAAWHRSCLVAFDQVRHRPVKEICAELVKRELLVTREVTDGEGALFANVNTPEEYERVVTKGG